MNSITPTSPLLTLVVEPQEGATAKNLLGQFHPIMKSLGYGHFGNEQPGFYHASKSGDGFFSGERFVFAEVDENAVVINMDGHSVFGLKGVEDQLRQIKEQYESLGASAKILGPNYASAFVGNLIYTALPIYASACLVIAMMIAVGVTRKSDLLNIFLYATIGVVGAKTRFWVNQRRKQRPVWQSVLILLLAAPVLLGAFGAIIWLLKTFA